MRYLIIGLICLIHIPILAQKSSFFHPEDSTFHYMQTLQEIIVKAEKRKLSPMEIPVALSVITPSLLSGESAPDLH